MQIQNGRTELNRLLQQRNEYPERATELDQQIHATFGETHAVLVLDMSGFSRLTVKYGIIHFLAMLQRLTTIAVPLIGDHGGQVIKLEADNIFAAFDNVDPAVEAAIDILKRLAAVNTGLPDSLDLSASIGIGYGEMLMLKEDMYGSELNLASKLGEDLARSGEVLLTKAAFDNLQIEDSQVRKREWEELRLAVSELELIAYKIVFSDPLQSTKIGTI